MTKRTYKIIQLIILIYVGIGSIAILGVYPSDFFWFGEEWSIYATFFTLPTNIISFGYRFFETDKILPVLIIQFCVLIIFSSVSYLIYKNTKQK